MTIVAGLLVNLGANVARLQQDMNQASRVIGRWDRSTKRSLSTLKTAFATLGVSIGAGAFVVAVKRTLELADEMGKLAARAGVTTETMSGFAHAADLSGVSIEQLTTGLAQLAKNMADMQAGTGEARLAFEALGIPVTNANGSLKATDTMLLELADRFSTMRDSTEKSALAMRIFGKAGGQLIPFLNEGRAGIQRLHEEAEKLGLIVGGDMAAAAQTFNDNLRAVTKSGRGLLMTMLTPLLPKLNNIAVAMKEAAKESGLFMAALVGIGGVITEAFRKTDEQQIAAIEKRLQGVREQWLAIRNAPPGFRTGQQKRLNALEQEMNGLLAEQEEIQARIAHRERERAKAAAEAKKGDQGPGMKDEAAERKRLAEIEALLKRGDAAWIAYIEAVKEGDAALEAIGAPAESFTQWAEKSREAVLDNIDPTRRLARELNELTVLYRAGYLTLEQFNRAATDPAIRELLAPEKDIFAKLNEALKEGDISLDQYQQAVKRVRGEMSGVKDDAKEIGLIFSSAASDAIRHWQGVGNLIKSIAIDIAQLVFKKTVSDPIADVIGGALKGVDLGAIFGGGPSPVQLSGPFAHGGSFTVGGGGGTDSQLVAFRASPGEEVSVRTSGQQAMGGGGPIFNVDMRGASAEAVARLERLVAQVNGSIERRAISAVADARMRGGAFAGAFGA